MTTLEKLFVQIFERKDRIIEQAQQQADSYTQQLASTLLIDGITPPPWLLSPNFDSHSSDPNGLEKEEIISKLLLRPPRDSVAYSIGGCSLYRVPVITRGDGWLSNEKCMKTHASNKGLNVSNGPATVVECRDNDVGCNLNCVAELDDSVNSPQNETDARISDIYAEPGNSLVRIQRSKSRQKARELRTNMKGATKSCLSHENRTRISFSGNLISESDFQQVTQDKCPLDLAKCNDTNGANSAAAEGKGDKGNDRTSHGGKLTRSSCSHEKPGFLNDHSKAGVSFEKEDLDGAALVQLTGKALRQSGHVSGVKEVDNLPDVSLRSYAAKESITRKTQDAQRESKFYCGRTTRSRSSSQQTSGINKSSKRGTSSCNPEDGRAALAHSVGNLMHQLDASSKLLDAVQTSWDLGDGIGEIQPSCSNEGSLKPVSSSNIAARRVTRSRSCSMKETPLGKSLVDSEGNALQNTLASQPIACLPTGTNHKENAATVVGNGPIDAPDAVNRGINLNSITLFMESEGLDSRKSSDCCMVVKPKQLDFDETDECDLNEICSPRSKKRKLDGLSGQECCPSKESAASIDHKSSCTFFEPQLPLGNVLSSKPIAARTHHHDSIGERVQDETMDIEPDMNGNSVVEDVQHNTKVPLHDDIDSPCEVSISSKEAQNSSDEEKHPGKFHLNEDNVSSSKMQIEEGDVGYKGEESVAVVCIPESKHTESSFMSSLTKQGNKDSQDCLGKEVRSQEQDLGSSKSKELEIEMNLKLSNMKLDSAKVHTWPWNQRRKVEDQPNCFSASRGFRIPLYSNTQRNNIDFDLACENDLHAVLKSASVLSSEDICVSQSNDTQSCDKGVQNGMMCDFAEGTESSHKLQFAEVTVSEVDDGTAETPYTLKQSGASHVLNLTLNAADDSTNSSVFDVGAANPTSNDEVAVTDGMNSERSLPERVSCLEKDGPFSYGSVRSPQIDEKTMVGCDEIMPVFEGFIIDEQAENARIENAGVGIDLDTLEMPSTTIERASILEQICKSVSKQTPMSQFSSTFKQRHIQDLYGFEANGLLEHMNLRHTVPFDEDSSKHLRASYSHISAVDYAFPKQQNFDSFTFSATPFSWQSKNHYSSPVGKLWERSASSSGSSERQLSSNPELTCFPIEEDPSSNEESYNAEEVSDEPTDRPAEPTNPRRENVEQVDDEIQEGIVSRVANDPAEGEPPLLESAEVCSQQANPVSTQTKYRDRCSSNSVNTEVSFSGTHNKVKHKPKIHPGIKVSRYGVENRTSSYRTRGSSRGNVSLLSEYSKNKSNVKKGIARLSQKEAKRNNIVSNITSFIPMVQQKQAAAVCTGKRDIKVKALEAAEAAKRREQEKENERKMKKEALKIERARMEKENAREMELNKKKKQEEQKKKEADIAARKRQKEQDERKQMAKKRKHVAEARKEQKLQYEKSRAGKAEKEKQQAKNAETAGSRKGSDDATENLRQNRSTDENNLKKRDTELRTDGTLASDVQQVTSVPDNRDASNDGGDNEKATSIFEKSPIRESAKSTIQENSYDISPYQCSDDEDDEEDDIPTKKFVPSWASKTNIALVLPLQQKLNPEKIFSIESFCSMDEVLLPRRLQQQ